MAVNLSPFIEDAKRIQAETGIPASIILGQIMLESSGKYEGGLSGLAVRAKNLFGIKGSGTAGSVNVPTTEYRGGVAVTEYASFRKYNSFYESMLDHAKLLSSPRYASKLKDAKSVNDYAVGIKAGGYATDPSYVNKLLGIISSNNLHQYDSGNITFKPLMNVPESGGSSTGGEAQPGQTLTGSGIFFHAIRAGLVVMLFILMVIFFLKAFPAVESTAGTVANLVPQAKALKAVKGAAK